MAAIPQTAIAEQISAAPDPGEALARLADENELLRAALAEMRERVRELEGGAERDGLTGMPNRRRFLDALERITAQANRHGTPAALIEIDLDGLQTINARHGCLAGDAALIHVGKLLHGLIRTADLAARTGEDEFALLLDHLDQDSAIDAAERIARCIVERPLDLGGTRVRIGATVAVTTILRGDRVEEILARAARNMERAKA